MQTKAMGDHDNKDNQNASVAPQTQSDLKHLKETYITVATTIDKMREPSNELSTLAIAMSVAVLNDRCATDPDFATFLYEDMGPGLAKRLSKERSNDENYLKVVADVLEQLVRLFANELKQKRFSYPFYSAMTLLFNHEAVLHKYHYQIADSDLQRLRTHGQGWRKDLQVGDMIDVYVKADDRGKLSGWMQAQIMTADGDDLYLEFPLSQNIYDGRMDRWSTDLVQFETKTKEDYEWRRQNLVNATMLEVDVHDKSSWNKATIFEVKKQTVTPTRIIDLAYCALRVYRDHPNSQRKDDRGTYEGWSVKFDEWVPVFSPRIMAFATKVGVLEEEEISDNIDEMMPSTEEFKEIFAVPRLQVCISDLYLRYINIFGNEGCFDIIIDLLKDPEVETKHEKINITIMGCLAQILTLPYAVFHRKFIQDKGKLISDTIKNRLVITTDQALRDVRKEQVDAIIKSVESISRRFLNRADREKQTEVLRLDLCNKSLVSNFLERRIQGIKDLTLLVRNNTAYSSSSRTFTTEFLIEWMVKNDVFASIWDYKRTHLQIVQRSSEIFKLLLQEERLDDEILKLFWSLTKGEYQAEVLKIISDCSLWLRQPQIEYFFNEVTLTPAEKLSLPEFDLLCDLGKQCKSAEFQKGIENFFWHIIASADNYKEDLVDNATKKFAEMVKPQTLAQKQALLNQLVAQIKASGQKSVIPTLRLFTKLVKDQRERNTASSYQSSYTPTGSATVMSQEPAAQYSHVSATGNIITSYSYKPAVPQEESIYNNTAASEDKETASTVAESANENKENEKELTLTDMLNSLQTEAHLVDALLDNLNGYCKAVRAANIDASADRKKVFIQSKNHSHADEIEERLTFLKQYASVCDYQFRKVQLRVIYDSLSVQSPIKQDQTEFLVWCKQACQDSTADVVILDLNEVGEYFSELMNNSELDLQTLPIAGFEFLQNYFLSVNENSKSLLRIAPKKKSQAYTTSGVTWNSYYLSQPAVTEEPEEEEPEFNVLINPSALEKLDLIWMVVKFAGNPKVAKKATDFLIKIYMSLDETLQSKRAEISQELIAQCIARLGSAQVQSLEIERIVMILRSVIQEAEKKGTGDVQPHNAILKGESLDRVIIKNSTRGYAPNLVVKVLTSATVWEFVDKVSRMCDLAPHYSDFKLSTGYKIKEVDYGKTLGEIGLRNYDIVTVKKNDVEDEVIQEVLVDPETDQLSVKARAVFSEWFDKYSNAEGVMTPQSTTRFILGATNELIQPDDGRIKGLFAGYDTNKDDILVREEFLKFYTDAARDKPDRVFDNLKNHFIRGDLLKLSQVYEDQSFAKNEMPRYTLSHNQAQFDTLISLLDRNDGTTSSQVWELIRMLATNQQIYQQVLSLQLPTNDAQNPTLETAPFQFWKSFFESGSIYKQSYAHEIIEALMEDGQDLTNRVFFVEFQDAAAHYNNAVLPIVKHKEVNLDNQSLKENWTNKFLENGGLSYVINAFLARCGSSLQDSDTFKLQEVKFMLSILRVYISSAISAQTLIKQGGEAKDFTTRKIIEIMKGSCSSSLLDEIDFKELQNCLLGLIAQIVPKEAHSTEEKNIVANALTLWKSCMFHKQSLFVDFLTTDRIDNLVMAGLLYCTDESIRQNFQTTLLQLARTLTTASSQTESALGFLLKLLSKNFHQISEHPCRQFFELFNELIDLHFIKVELGSDEKGLFDPEELLGQIIDKIRADNAQNRQTSQEEVDEVQMMEQAAEKERLMIGLVLLTQKIIGKVDTQLSEKIVREKDLINEIFKEFLFSSVFSQDTKVQGDAENMLDIIRHKAPRKLALPTTGGKVVNKSREAAYNLLNQLIQKSPVIMNNFIRDQLKPLLEMIKKPKTWNYTPPGSSERVQKYVGLRNLGCICYMNSMMQQFFMIPAFRYNLLCVDDGIAEDIKDYKSESIDDNMLHQMQRLFAHLELSERSDYNPIGFTFSFKEFDGQPTNTGEQKDAQEFLNVLFDRVENALKPTPRKYLLQSVFGGKTCSQLICPECGKVKNKIEVQNTMSLTVKDINSVYDSLEKQIEGERIDGFLCDGCNKKVDITKRMLIAETPNVLIVHLQRILFNFDTFQNDKLNQHFEFPTMLDLKPYSYYEVMKKENRLKKEAGNGEGEDEGEGEGEEPKADEVEEDGDGEKKDSGEDDGSAEPIEDDCYEYKLVGVNVHSGSANAGHYWSYINTVRGLEEKNGNDPTWADTDKDQWMEFNDSTVKDYKFENLKEECFGDKPGSQSTASAWNFAGKYGKSGYMLFYERRVKKPIKIVVPADQVANHTDLHFDAKTNEYIKNIAYREGVDTEKPNQIFSKVLEDNTKFSFENDVYSQEFFDFIKQILQSVASFGGINDQTNKEMRSGSIQVAQKAAFDILSRCFYNSGIKDLCQVMIQIFQQDEQLIIDFCSSVLDTNDGEAMLEILLDCTDSTARNAVGDLWRWLLCKAKMIERTLLAGDDHQNTVSARLLKVLQSNLPIRAAKNWTRFDKYLELFQAFALQSPQEVLDSTQNISGVNKMLETSENEAAQVGLAYFFRTNKLEQILDFVLAEKSPLFISGQIRVTMGGSYSQPNFTPLMKIVSEMMGQKNLIERHPLSEIAQQMMTSNVVLGKIVEDNAANKDFGFMLTGMCRDNLRMTKKLAKIFLKAFNQNSADKIAVYLKALKKFLSIEDSLQMQRLEWIFGVPQLKTSNAYRSIKYQYGAECIERINDTAYTFISTLSSTFQPTTESCLLERLLAQRGRLDDFCIKAIKDLISLCVKDVKIARFIYRLPPNSYQNARYCDWFTGYIDNLIEEQEKASHSFFQPRATRAAKCQEKLKMFKTVCQQFVEEDDAAIKKVQAAQDYRQSQLARSWMMGHAEVLQHWPPQYIVGKQCSEDKPVLLSYEDDFCTVSLMEVSCEYIYGNPTGVFNLSLSERLMRTKNYTFISYSQFKTYQQSQQQQAQENEQDNQEQQQTVFETRDWVQHHTSGPVLLQIMLVSKQPSSLKIEVTLGIQGESPNVVLPCTAIKETVFGHDKKAVAHFLKLEPGKPWGGNFTLQVTNSRQKSSGTSQTVPAYPDPMPPSQHSAVGYSTLAGNNNSIQEEQDEQETSYECSSCQAKAYLGMDFCEKCGESLREEDYLEGDYRDGTWDTDANQ